MGTHRSRHNKGRKPMYKHFERDTARRHFFFDEKEVIATDFVGLRCTYCQRVLEDTQAASSVAATKDHYLPQSVGGKEVVPCCIQCNKIKADMLPQEWVQFMVNNPVWWKPARPQRSKPDEPKRIELVDEVARYLAKRKQERTAQQAEQERIAEINAIHAKDVFRSISGEGFSGFLDGPIVRSSERDILLQMYVEKKISTQQLRAGRQWQHDMEAATIQPNTSIDWSEPRGGLHYQTRGTITERQHDAMTRRKEFSEAMGAIALRALDYCFDADRGRAELVSSLAGRGNSVDGIIRELLDLLASAKGSESPVMRKTA